jgi:hypothetical protein
MKTAIVLSLLALSIAGCDGTDSNTTQSTQPDPNPRIDSDVTPPSGTGGGTEATSPDGTSSSVQKTTPNQPTPTD